MNTEDPALLEADQKIAASGIKVGQHYRHAKTQNVYVIESVGVFEPDFSPMVGYRRADQADSRTWFRFLTIFTGRIIENNVLVPRFVLVEVKDDLDLIVDVP